MYAHIKLLNGFKEPLLYQIPCEYENKVTHGTFVRVPLKQKIHTGIVETLFADKPAWCTFAVRNIAGLEPFPSDQKYQQFITQLSAYHSIEPLHFIQRIRHFLDQKIVAPRTLPADCITTPAAITLTDEQQVVVNFLSTAVTANQFTPTVLHGVTGSGKTEVYKKLIEHAYAQKKTTLLTLPEVTLALQFEALLKKQLDPSIPIISFHSASGPAEKRTLWKHLLNGTPVLIIGVHLPLLLPISNLGIIIIDEEHDHGYQEKKHPKINTKDAALLRARTYNIPILLGSATPSVSSLYNVKKRGWHFFQLKKRFNGAFPTVTTVLLNDKKLRRSFWISKELEQALKEQLIKKEQTIIFINRRGYSFFVQCKQCSFIFSCSSCSVSLTLHANNTLSCHYCGFTTPLAKTCSSCKADDTEFLKKGIGTQQVVTILEKLFPTARIGRADLDTTSKKKQWQQTVEQFNKKEIDILVGTQTITKGYHFPGVTLVGVLWADLNLSFPAYNATETTIQQLIQVAGRAGRASSSSRVIVQTMADHSAFNFINELSYLDFYEQELVARQEIQYPPYIRFAEIELKHTHEAQLNEESMQLAQQLEQLCTTHNLAVTVLGPAQPPIYKVSNQYIRKIYLKAADINSLLLLFARIPKHTYASKIYLTQNPLQ